MESASYDAWIKYYRADENTPNTAISYYVKGAVIGFLLDAHIRRADRWREVAGRRDAPDAIAVFG